MDQASVNALIFTRLLVSPSHSHAHTYLHFNTHGGRIRADRRGSSHVWLIAITEENPRRRRRWRKRERELSLRINEQDVGLYLRPRSKFSRQSRQTAIGSRMRTYCTYYGGEMGRSKIIYHPGGWVARSRGWPESDNSAFRDRDNAGSLFPLSSNRLLDYRSYRGLIERERESETL